MTRAERICDAIRQFLEVRQDEVLTRSLIEDRARNGTTYILEALLAEEEEARTPVGRELHEMEEHARKVIT